MAVLLSVNVGRAKASEHTDLAVTGIDKRPVTGPLRLADPGPKGAGASGVQGDDVCDTRHHGGSDQAVYAYAQEDLDGWSELLGRRLSPGIFGENLTTGGLDVTGSRLGERWSVGAGCVLEVSAPRIPCRTFTGWMGETGWVKRFNHRGAPGAYLRVIVPGEVEAGDPIAVVSRPDHQVTIGHALKALTLDPSLLPSLLAAGDALPGGIRERAESWIQRHR